MDLRIPNIVKPIALKEYAQEFGEAVIWVWVNPTRALRMTFIETILSGKATDEQISAWFSEIWSQGPEDSRFTPEGILELTKNCMDNDPQLWIWLVRQTSELITEHLGAKKKTSSTPPSS